MGDTTLVSWAAGRGGETRVSFLGGNGGTSGGRGDRVLFDNGLTDSRSVRTLTAMLGPLVHYLVPTESLNRRLLHQCISAPGQAHLMATMKIMSLEQLQAAVVSLEQLWVVVASLEQLQAAVVSLW